jgi:hypothetical protein
MVQFNEILCDAQVINYRKPLGLCQEASLNLLLFNKKDKDDTLKEIRGSTPGLSHWIKKKKQDRNFCSASCFFDIEVVKKRTVIRTFFLQPLIPAGSLL